jgi:hypothetical protein
VTVGRKRLIEEVHNLYSSKNKIINIIIPATGRGGP